MLLYDFVHQHCVQRKAAGTRWCTTRHGIDVDCACSTVQGATSLSKLFMRIFAVDAPSCLREGAKQGLKSHATEL